MTAEPGASTVDAAPGQAWMRPATPRRAHRLWLATATVVLAGLAGFLIARGDDGTLTVQQAGLGPRRPASSATSPGYQVRMTQRLDEARAVAVAPAGEAVWVGTQRAGLVRWAPARDAYEHYPLPDGELGTISVLAVSLDGAVWAGTSRSRGVWRFDGIRWRHYTARDGLAGDGVEALAVSPDGAVWAATSNGVSRFDNRRWTSPSDDRGPTGRRVYAVDAGDENTIWATTRRRVWRFDDGMWTWWDTSDTLGYDRATVVAAGDDGTAWMPTAAGVSHFDGRRWTTTSPQQPPGDDIVAAAVDSGHTLWVATRTGAAQFDGGEWTSSTIDHGLAGSHVYSVAASDHSVWAATLDGLFRFDGSDWTAFLATGEPRR